MIPEAREARPGPGGEPKIVLQSLLIVAAALTLLLALRGEINWDEFLFLSRVHDYRQGRLDTGFQTAYVHLFGWLTTIPGTAVDRITAARVFYYSLLLVSAALLYRLSTGFLSRVGSTLVCIAFFSFSAVLVHGPSFRADGLALLGYMACLVFLFRDGSRWVGGTVAGFAFGFTLLMTVKGVLLLLAIIPLLVVGSGREVETLSYRLERLSGFVLGSLLGFGSLFLLHLTSVAAQPESTITSVQAAGEKTLLSTTLIPQLPSLRQILILNPTLSLLLVGGIAYLVIRAYRDQSRHASLQLLCLTAPLASILFYRNSYPYFYALIIPPALIVVGLAYDRLRLALQWPRHFVWMLPALLLAHGTITFAIRWNYNSNGQDALLETIQEIFPSPVPYIDALSMVAEYPKVGFFMSSWGVESYFAEGRSVFRDIVADNQPKFLLANSSDLEVFDHVYASEPRIGDRTLDELPVSHLLPADRKFLRSQFVHHWGPVYVPGISVGVPADTFTAWETVIPGTYTLEADLPIRIDGELIEPGAAVELESGVHELSTDSVGASVVLRWGTGIHRPVEPPPAPPIFAGF